MNEIHIDIETFSSVDLTKCGVYKYAESPDFEILLFGYSVDGGEVQVVDLANGECISSEIVSALSDTAIIKYAHNATFERVCLSRFLGYCTGEYLEPASWRCTLVWASYLGLPKSLAEVGEVLKLEDQKLAEGKELIKMFCMPQASRFSTDLQRVYAKDAPDTWALFKKYNKRDVEVEMHLVNKLSKFPVPDFLWREYELDQRINDRGIRVDGELVHQAIAMDEISRSELEEEMKRLTGLENPNSILQLHDWLKKNGIETSELGKKTVQTLIDNTTSDIVRQVLALRLQLAKSSVKKYTAMQNAVCSDGRVRGMFQFYGANRTGRFTSRIVQLQNLPQNHIPDLAQARELVKCGDYEAVKMLYDDVPDTLSQLVRTAFIPRDGAKFYVADFSAIEARVIAWLAGEEWRQELFAKGGDIYCQSASQMFKVPVEKHGINGHLRQKGKIAELACIAEGQLVLTDKGLIPIEDVTTEHLLWDGENWVTHSGVIFKGEREVMEYDGLTATPDHLVWVEGKQRPIRFEEAAACGAHLVQTGDGGNAIRLGENNLTGETVECGMEQVLRTDSMYGMRLNTMAGTEQLAERKIPGMPILLTTASAPGMVRKADNSGKAEVRKSEMPGVFQLRRKRDKVRVSERHKGGAVSYRASGASGKEHGDRPNRQQRKLRSGKHPVFHAFGKLLKSALHRIKPFRTEVLAVCAQRDNTEAVIGREQGADNRGCASCGGAKAKMLATHLGKARLYDIRDAGEHHRFTVSGRLVHNCGYGGSVGALTAMGALDMGLSEDELQPLVDSWRSANPNIVKFWWDVDRAVKKVVKDHTPTVTHELTFTYESKMLFIQLPSGRRLCYVKPEIGEDSFGSESVTYMGTGATKKWERIESYGPKFVENIVQATARDLLCYALMGQSDLSIVAHVHDEMIVEAGDDLSLDTLCKEMAIVPQWAQGLLLRADGYTCDFYMKD